MHILGKLNDSISKGWLECEIDGGRVFLAQFTKVKLISKHKSYELIELLEGRYKSKIAQIPYYISDKNLKLSYLVPSDLRNLPAKLVYFSDKHILEIKGLGKFSAHMENIFQEREVFKIKLPDYPHTEKYSSEYFSENLGGSRFVETWFKLIPEESFISDSYLHYGTLSKGCLTVVYISGNDIWNKIYFHLMKHRLDNLYIGTLVVINKSVTISNR